MSSKYVRDGILQFLTDNISSETVIDLTADFETVQDMVSRASLSPDDVWLGIQFLPSLERPVGLSATNTTGKYREEGIINLYVVDIAKLGVINDILIRAEAIRDTFRGQRIATSIVIEGVNPPAFGNGVSLSFEGGYTSAVVQIDYYRDLDL